MDWNAAIEKNREALKRVLAMLVTMAGLGPHPEVRAEGEPRRTLPRHLHRAVLCLGRQGDDLVEGGVLKIVERFRAMVGDVDADLIHHLDRERIEFTFTHSYRVDENTVSMHVLENSFRHR